MQKGSDTNVLSLSRTSRIASPSSAPTNHIADAPDDTTRDGQHASAFDERLSVDEARTDECSGELEVLLATGNQLRDRQIVRLDAHCVTR